MTKRERSTVDDPEGLRRALAEMQRASESGSAPAMQRAWREVWDYLGHHVTSGAEPEKAAIRELVHTGQVTPKRSQRGERHDGRRAPSGTEYADGILWSRRYPPPAPSQDEHVTSADLFVEILRDIIHVAWPREWAEAERKLETLLRDGPPKPDAHPRYLLRVRTAIKGPLPDWASRLESLLMAKAWYEAEDRLRAAHKDPVPSGVTRLAPEGAEQIWEALRHEYGASLPGQLTPAAIEKMLDGVALNRGGRKDVAHKVVLNFVETLEK